MKSVLRSWAQRLGWYNALGIAAARFKGLAYGVWISRPEEGVYCLWDRNGHKIFINRRHSIYLSDLTRYFDFYFRGALPNSRNEVHYEKPDWHTPPRWGHPLFFTSFVESEDVLDLYLLHGCLKPGQVVLDIGAYCGLTTFGFAQKVGEQGHVYTFEPDPENFLALEKNLARYPAANITIENAAVWRETGPIELQAEGTVASIIQVLAPRTDSVLRVRAVSLDDYVSSHAIPRVDLIKLDAEGAEVDILASARDVLRRYQPRIILEAHLVHGKMTTGDCRRLLEEEGYDVAEVTQPGTKSPLLVGKPGQFPPRLSDPGLEK